MAKPVTLLFLALAWLAGVGVGGAEPTSPRPAAPAPVPLPQAHSHNDYEHARPLLDALDQGFCSVEADIYLVDRLLLVAHDRAQVRPERTLQALYLDPLRARVKANEGRVYRDGPKSFTLLIDIKTAGAETYRRLREVLEPYRDLFTQFEADQVRLGAITAILSGDRPWDLVAGESRRLVALDGRMSDLERNPSSALVPLVSDNWKSHFAWNGEGPMPSDQRAKLDEMVKLAHGQGRRIRFWGARDVLPVWELQQRAGVDVINTDHLAELAAFLKR